MITTAGFIRDEGFVLSPTARTKRVISYHDNSHIAGNVIHNRLSLTKQRRLCRSERARVGRWGGGGGGGGGVGGGGRGDRNGKTTVFGR